MDKIKIDYKLALFLYVYLNQIDLSLDRSRWVPLVELKDYYKTQIPPEKVASYLLKKFDVETSSLQKAYYVIHNYPFAIIQDWFLLNFKNETFLRKEEMYYCIQKLLLLDKYLKSNLEINKLEIEKLRIEFSKLTFGSLKFKLFTKDKKKATRIDHFLQNKNLDVINIKEFSSGIDW